jgi:hypothetical protein
LSVADVLFFHLVSSAACACTASTNTIAASSPIIIFIIVRISLSNIRPEAVTSADLLNVTIKPPTRFFRILPDRYF